MVPYTQNEIYLNLSRASIESVNLFIAVRTVRVTGKSHQASSDFTDVVYSE